MQHVKPLALAALHCPSYNLSPPLFQGQTDSPTALRKHFSLMSSKQKHKNTYKNELVTEELTRALTLTVKILGRC